MLAFQNNQIHTIIDWFPEVWHHARNLQTFCRIVYAIYQINNNEQIKDVEVILY